MKHHRLLPVILALLLAMLPSCKPTETPDNIPTEPTETTVKSDKTDTAEPEDKNLLTHIFSETGLTFDNGITALNGSRMYVKDGKVSLFCTKQEQIDEEYVDKYYLCTFDLESGAREDRLLNIEIDGFHPSTNLVTDDALFITGNVYDSVLERSFTVLVKYSLADDTTTIINEVDSLLPQTEQGNFPGITGIASDKDGYIYLTEEFGVCVLNPDLTKSFDCVTSSYIRSIGKSSSGEVYVSIYGALQKVDKTTQNFGDMISLPEDTDAESIYFGEGYDCYFTDSKGLYGYNFNSDSADLVMDWTNSNFDNSTLSDIVVVSPEKIMIKYREIVSEYPFVNNYYSIFNKADDIDISEITQVNVAYFSDWQNTLPKYVVDYNKSHPTVRIASEDYSAYNSDGDLMKAANKLVTEMLTNIYTPDIICMRYGEYKWMENTIMQLIDNDLCADMYQFIENDPDIKKDDIMGAVINTFEIDGELKAVMPSFSVKTLVAPKSEVGELTSWNYEQVLDFINSLPEGKKLSDDSFTALKMNRAFEMFIDYENKTCNFDNPVCAELLEKYVELSRYREQAQVNNDIYNNITTMEPGVPVCCERVYDSVDKYQWDEVALLTKDYVRIGYPTENGNGSTVGEGYIFIITKSSAHSKEAWDFIRSVILDRPRYDSISRNVGIRMLRSQNESYKEDMKQYFKFFPYDTSKYRYASGKVENRDKILDENGLYNRDPGTLVMFVEEDYDAFLDFLDSAGSPINKNIPSDLEDIITEEINVYKEGGRDAQKTAEILQSRISIYLSERS